MVETTVVQRNRFAGIAARLAALLTCALAATVASCTQTVGPQPVASLTLSPTADSVEVGRDVQSFTVAMLDAAGKIVSGPRVVWRSSNEAIATVDQTGKVHGVAVGIAVITASTQGHSDDAAIKVISPVTQILLTPDSIDVPLTTTKQINAQLIGPNGEPIIGRVVSWSSGNTAVATVSSAGIVSAVSVGTTTITVSAGAKTATAKVRVTGEPVLSVRITPQVPVQVVRLGQTFSLSASCLGTSGQILAGRTINWTSGNPSVATVSQLGVVSALALGSASIVADCEGRTAQITIQVTLVPVTSVAINPTSLTLLVGQQQQLAVIAKDSANNVLTLQGRSVIWTSDNLPIATVSGAGVVAGFSQGAANVQVTVDGVASTPIPVTVNLIPVATVQVLSPSASVNVGGSFVLTLILRDGNGNLLSPNGRTIQWSSSNSNVLSVAINGLVTGVSTGGPVTITATCEGKSGSVQITVVP
jgi:uncharacterized protein YjdB